jgi:hypothetical protein
MKVALASATQPRYSITALVLTGLIAAFAAVPAGAHTPGAASGDAQHPTAHVDDHDDMTWPPQPRGITNVVPLAEEREASAVAEQSRADAQERTVMLRSDVRRALGARFTRTTVGKVQDKSGAPAASRLTYFSYSKNVTVEVTLDGERVREVKIIPAAEYQPEITDEEIAEAEQIARAHFRAGGVERVESLQAFGILAYHNRGTGFYDTRVIYVSFHPDPDAPPEYAAWVDLSKRRVLRSREERR